MSHFDRLAVMMHMNGTDGSQQTSELGGHATQFGRDARLRTGTNKFGTASAQFVNSSLSFINVLPIQEDASDFWMGPGVPPFAIEFWVNWSAVPTTDQCLVAHRGAESADTSIVNVGFDLRWVPTAGGRIEFRYSIANGQFTTPATQAFTPAADTWYHIRLVRHIDRVVSTFIGGVRSQHVFGDQQLQHPISLVPDLVIGNQFDGSEPLIGFIDDFRWLFGDVIPNSTPVPVPTGELDPLDAVGADTRIFASPLIAKTATPADQTELWEPAQFMLANWTRKFRLAAAYNTRISQPTNQAEKRTQLLDRPYRVFNFRISTFDQKRTHGLGNQMLRWATARTLLPLYSDRTKLTVSAASGQPIISCNTVDRRFYVGQRVLIANDIERGELTRTEILTIDSFDATSITFDSNLTDSWPPSSLVYPLIEAKQVLNMRRIRQTGHISRADLRLMETEGRTAMPSPQNLDTIPAGIDSYAIPTEATYPIWKWTFQDASELIERAGQENNIGRATFTDSYGDRPKFGLRGDLCFLTRAEAFEFIRFFHSRGGRTCPFWVASSFTEYDVQAVNPTNVEIPIVGEVGDWSFRPFLAFRLFDETVIIRQIVSVVRGSTVDVVQFTDPIAFTLADLQRTGRGALARFNVDEMAEDWETDEAMRTNVGYIETLDEKFISANIEFNPTPLIDTLSDRADVLCDGCDNSDEVCELVFDATPGTDSEGGP